MVVYYLRIRTFVNFYIDNYELFSWGNGDGGKLGHSTEDSQSFPERVESMRSVKVK